MPRRKNHNEPYEPTPEEIAEATRRIREVGYRDEKGVWQKRWGKFDHDLREPSDGRETKMD